MSVCWCVRGLCVCWCVRGLCVCVSQTLNPAVPDLSNLAPLQVVRANTHSTPQEKRCVQNVRAFAHGLRVARRRTQMCKHAWAGLSSSACIQVLGAHPRSHALRKPHTRICTAQKSHRLNGHPCLLLSSPDRRFVAHSIPSLPPSPSSSPPPSLTRARAHSSASCPALALSLPPSFPPPHLCILLNSRDRPLYRPLKSPSLPPSSAALHRPQLAPHPLRQRPANVRRLILLRRRTAAPPACRRHAVRRTANRFADGPSRLTCPGCPFSGRLGHEARRCRGLCGPSKPYERLQFARVTNNN